MDRQKVLSIFTDEDFFRPASAGTLRVRAYAGTDNTFPIVRDDRLAIVAGDIGNIVSVPITGALNNPGDDLFIEITGVDLFGGLQTSGQFSGQTVPWFQSTFSIVEAVRFLDRHDIEQFVLLNPEYRTAVEKDGFIVFNTFPTATVDTFTDGLFTAGVASTSNPTLITDGSGTFSANDIILITRGPNILENDINEGLYEVLSHSGNTLTITGVGTTARTQDFVKDQFTFQQGTGFLTKVSVSVIRATDAEIQVGFGDTMPLTFITTSLVGFNEIEVRSASDIDDLATGGVITITDELTITIKTPSIVSSTRFVFSGFGSLTIKSDNSGSVPTYTYSGTGTFVSGPGNFIVNSSVRMQSSSTGTLMAVTEGVLQLVDSLFLGWDDLGTATNAAAVDLAKCLFSDWGAPLVIESAASLTVDTIGSFAWPTGLNLIETSDPRQAMATISVSGLAGEVEASAHIIRIDPDLVDSTSVVFIGNAFTGGGLFDISGGSTGTFTAVADASVASTTITSVTDSSGIARFNFSVGPTLFVNQEVTNVDFIENTTYNIAGIITAVGAGFFEIARITFTGSEVSVGSFTSDSVTLTDTGTTLSDGDTLTISSDVATDYDSGATVYNQLTNTFQINRAVTGANPQTGTWDTAGIDQSDLRIIAKTNPAIVDSANIGCAFVNNNSTPVGTIVNNTFTDIVFGTTGTALIECSNTERWKLIDELNGTFEYTGKEPFNGAIDYNYSVVSSGGAVEFRFKWQKDTGSGFADLTDNVEALAQVGGTASSITKTQPLTAIRGDKIKPLVTRNTGTSAITVRYATINSGQ